MKWTKPGCKVERPSGGGGGAGDTPPPPRPARPELRGEQVNGGGGGGVSERVSRSGAALGACVYTHEQVCSLCCSVNPTKSTM